MPFAYGGLASGWVCAIVEVGLRLPRATTTNPQVGTLGNLGVGSCDSNAEYSLKCEISIRGISVAVTVADNRDDALFEH